MDAGSSSRLLRAFSCPLRHVLPSGSSSAGIRLIGPRRVSTKARWEPRKGGVWAGRTIEPSAAAPHGRPSVLFVNFQPLALSPVPSCALLCPVMANIGLASRTWQGFKAAISTPPSTWPERTTLLAGLLRICNLPLGRAVRPAGGARCQASLRPTRVERTVARSSSDLPRKRSATLKPFIRSRSSSWITLSLKRMLNPDSRKRLIKSLSLNLF